MASVKKGVLVASKEWAKHLRPYGRKAFWHQNRQAERKLAAREVSDLDRKS